MRQLDRIELSGLINRLMYSRKLLLLLAVCGSLITAAVATWIFRIESKTLSQQFYAQVDDRALFLSRELDASTEALYTLGEVIRYVDSLPALVFDDVAEASLARNPSVAALEWLPRVSAAQLNVFEDRQQRYHEGFSVSHLLSRDSASPDAGDDAVVPAPRNLPGYFPVAYVSPKTGNEKVLGVDFFSESSRRDVLKRAWLSGELAFSQPLKLLQMDGDERGALLAVPVYFGRPETDDERLQALKGFVIAAIDMRRVVARIVGSHSPEAKHYMRIEDVTDEANPEVLFSRGVRAEHLEQYVDLAVLGGRKLRVTMAPDAVRYRLDALYFPVVVAFAGGLMVLLVCGYLYLLQRRGKVISQHVRKQTQALREANFRLETLSVTDPLTGLSNRRAFDDYLALEWHRASRDQLPITVLLVDVDHFKKINDQYGHPAGDACLRELAQRLRDHFKRPADRVVRFGGEEFAVVMPGTNPGALAQADRFRESMATTGIQLTEGESIVVTISAGLATVVPPLSAAVTADADQAASPDISPNIRPNNGLDAAVDMGSAETLSPRDLIKFADEALYQAKRGGRNRIECYNGPDSSRAKGV